MPIRHMMMPIISMRAACHDMLPQATPLRARHADAMPLRYYAAICHCRYADTPLLFCHERFCAAMPPLRYIRRYLLMPLLR